MKPGENPPVGLILCTEKGAAEAHYALENLGNKILAAECQTVFPDEKLIAKELENHVASWSSAVFQSSPISKALKSSRDTGNFESVEITKAGRKEKPETRLPPHCIRWYEDR